MTNQSVVRMGVLGAARIVPMALLRPAQTIEEVSVEAIAARDPERARRFAEKHGVPRVHDSYEALLADPQLDAVYIPLPNGLHAEWSIRALEAGKHVLCEKPMAANARQAEQMAETASRTGRVLCEGMHYRFHPIAERMQEIVRTQLGTIRHVEAHLCVPIFWQDDVRYRYDLGGGATMDVGCYTINIMRFLAGQEPEVTEAHAKLAAEQVDRSMDARFRFPSGCTGRIYCSIRSLNVLRTNVRVWGDQGLMRVFNPYMPQLLWHRIKWRGSGGQRSERVTTEPTFQFQLRAFARAILGQQPLPVGPEDAVANMRVIDAVYRAAGLQPRGAEGD